MHRAVAIVIGLTWGCTAEAPEPVEEKPAVFGRAGRATGGFPSVVLFEPETGGHFPLPSEPAVMDQNGRQFSPGLLVVRVGQPVVFRNSEDEAHNVHVIDGETRVAVFNVVTPIHGDYTHVFQLPGAYDVSCNIHPAMAAYIVVTQTPYYAVADKNGAFTLSELPPGGYAVSVWNLDPGRRVQKRVEIGGKGTELHLVPAAK